MKAQHAATGEFKAIAESSAMDELAARASFFGAKVDDRELYIIDSDHQASFFCNDKSGFSMVEAMQGAKQQRDSADLRGTSKEWILNSELLDSQAPTQQVFDAQAYESNGQKDCVKPFDRIQQVQDTAKFGGDKRAISFTQSISGEENLFSIEQVDTSKRHVGAVQLGEVSFTSSDEHL